jgi:RNA polymerase sigma factor (TIGR02999 family)
MELESGQQSPSKQVTRLLLEWQKGNKAALDELTPLLYQELRRVAAGYLRRERTDHTLQPTALIHEAYMRMVGNDAPAFESRAHFFGVAANLMRQILVDHARAQRAEKRGGGGPKLPLDEAVSYSQDRSEELVALDDALRELAAFDERKSKIVEMRFFGGLSIEEIAVATSTSVATVGRELRLSQAWLYRAMSSQQV